MSVAGWRGAGIAVREAGRCESRQVAQELKDWWSLLLQCSTPEPPRAVCAQPPSCSRCTTMSATLHMDSVVKFVDDTTIIGWISNNDETSRRKSTILQSGAQRTIYCSTSAKPKSGSLILGKKEAMTHTPVYLKSTLCVCVCVCVCVCACTGRKVEQTIDMVNGEEEPFHFSVVQSSLLCDDQRSSLFVRPMTGTVAPKDRLMTL